MKLTPTRFLFLVFPVLCTSIAHAQNVGIGETNPTESKLQVKTADSSVLLIQNTGNAANTKTALYYKNSSDYSGSIATIQTQPGFYRMGMFTYGGAISGLKERISILDAGNVGINNTNPTAVLDVIGNVKIADGTQGANKVLTSDAAGNASWQKAADGGGTVGYGTWGDCSTNGISEHQPVADVSPESGDYFGRSVAISGDLAIVGIPFDNVGSNADQGSVAFYKHDGSKWVLIQRISDASGAANDYFGYSVSISGNYAFVGSHNDDIGANIDQGSVSVYQYNGSSWVFVQRLTDATGQAGDVFGLSVCVSGNFAIVGAPGDDNGFVNNGSVNFYQLVSGSWIFTQRSIDNTAAANDGLGGSVSIAGNYAIAGSPNDDVGSNSDQGSASTFFYNGSSWVYTQKLVDPAGVSTAYYGTSVSISGSYTAVGAPGDGTAGFVDAGSVHFYRLSGSWILMNKFIDTETFSAAAGVSVHISGDYAIVGANDDNVNPSTESGSSTVYVRVGLGWQKLQKFFPPGGIQFDEMGNAVGIDGTSKRFIVGQPGYAGSSGKVLFGKVN